MTALQAPPRLGITAGEIAQGRRRRTARRRLVVGVLAALIVAAFIVSLCVGQTTYSPREVLGVIGPNGAGKTTLLQLASARMHPTTGVAGVLGEVLGAVDVFDLTDRERDVLRLYAAGLPLKAVADRLGIAYSTAKENITRVRVKYVEVGRPAPTKVDLLRRAMEDGLVVSDRGDGAGGR